MRALTPEQIDALPAGRELDALVAQNIFGCKPVWSSDPNLRHLGPACHCGGGYGGNDPHADHMTRALKSYSTSIAAAWEVAEKLEEISLNLFLVGMPGKEWRAMFDAWMAGPTPVNVTNWTKAPTAPLAIVRAALKAKGALS